MKIFDCFMYFDEEQILDLRLNVLNHDVDYFVIVESIYNHKGEKRDLLFNIQKFQKFKEKIIYLIYKDIPKQIKVINKDDDENVKGRKYIMNALYRENSQRNFILEGLKYANREDLILISDVDEIPKLSSLDLGKIKDEIILFKQDMFYYKFNLKLPNLTWTGTKACKKKYLKTPQWLRNIKDRKYSFFRFDTFFSEKKYMSIKILNNGGWHFSNIKTPKEIEHKLRSYLHHREFDQQPLSVEEIDKIIKNKQAIYDLKVDKTVNKITPILFSKCPTPNSMLALGKSRLAKIIKPIGLAPAKSTNIINTCKIIIDKHEGKVPSTRKELEHLPGVGRKTANVVLNEGFNKPTIAVDTHVFRVANRTGLAPGKNVLATELKLLEVTPDKWLKNAHHYLLLHGRYICTAKNFNCQKCVIEQECGFVEKKFF